MYGSYVQESLCRRPLWGLGIKSRRGRLKILGPLLFRGALRRSIKLRMPHRRHLNPVLLILTFLLDFVLFTDVLCRCVILHGQ